MSEKLIFNCTHGKEDPERATLPFVAANVAATWCQRFVVVVARLTVASWFVQPVRTPANSCIMYSTLFSIASSASRRISSALIGVERKLRKF